MKLPRSFDSLPVEGRRVLVRADLNVPLSGGRIGDDTRIRGALPTLEALRARGARVIVCSHLGRPKGEFHRELSLRPVGARLAELLGVRVEFASDCIGPVAEQAVHALANGDVLLLENLRFHPGEQANDPTFAAALAALADIYVDDAFGAVHRAHASVVGVAELLPAAAGYLLRRELEVLGQLLDAPAHPFVVVSGGVKVSDKIGVIEQLAGPADAILVGGAMAYTFEAAAGGPGRRARCTRMPRDSARPRAGWRRAARPAASCCSRRTACAGGRSRPIHHSRSSRAARSTTAGWGSTSAPRRRTSTPPAYVTRRRSSGTARWAPSSSHRTPRARSRSPRRSPPAREPRSSAGATPSQR